MGNVDAAFADFEQVYKALLHNSERSTFCVLDELTPEEKGRLIDTGKALLKSLSPDEKAQFMARAKDLVDQNPSGYTPESHVLASPPRHVAGRSSDVLAALFNAR